MAPLPMGLFTSPLQPLPQHCPCTCTQPNGTAPSSHHAVLFPATVLLYVLFPLPDMLFSFSAWPPTTLPWRSPLQRLFPFSQAERITPSLVAHSLHTAEVLRKNNWDLGLAGGPSPDYMTLNEMLLLPEPHFASSEKWGQEPSSCSVLFHIL